MKSDFCFTFFDADATRDMSHMNRLERGAYIDFIIHQRKFNGITQKLAQKFLGKDFKKVWPSLELILSEEDGEYHIPWVRREMLKNEEYKGKQSARAKKRWAKPDVDNESHGNAAASEKSMPRDMRTHMPEACLSRVEDEYELEIDINANSNLNSNSNVLTEKKESLNEELQKKNYEMIKDRLLNQSEVQKIQMLFPFRGIYPKANTEFIDKMIQEFLNWIVAKDDLYRSVREYRSYFVNWIRTKVEKDRANCDKVYRNSLPLPEVKQMEVPLPGVIDEKEYYRKIKES